VSRAFPPPVAALREAPGAAAVDRGGSGRVRNFRCARYHSPLGGPIGTKSHPVGAWPACGICAIACHCRRTTLDALVWVIANRTSGCGISARGNSSAASLKSRWRLDAAGKRLRRSRRRAMRRRGGFWCRSGRPRASDSERSGIPDTPRAAAINSQLHPAPPEARTGGGNARSRSLEPRPRLAPGTASGAGPGRASRGARSSGLKCWLDMVWHQLNLLSARGVARGRRHA